MQPLTIWIAQPGEPLPTDREDLRLWRSGMLAAKLRDRGHRVIWWASTFRHLDREFRVREQTFLDWNGITLALVESPGYRRNVSVRRIWDHVRLGRNTARTAATLPEPDVIHAGYPPVEVCEAMVDYGCVRGIPVVIDVRDMWPEAFADVMPGYLRPLAAPALLYYERRARRMLSRATAIHGHTPTFRDYGLLKAGRSAGPLDRSFPFAYDDTPPSSERRSRAEAFWDQLGVHAGDDALTVCFFGSLTTERREVDHRTPARAFRMLFERSANVRAVYCGSGRVAEWLTREFIDVPDRFVMPGYVDAAQIWALMGRSHLGLLPYMPARDFSGSLPNKSIEYLSGGLPVVTSLTKGYLFDRFRKADCIVTYPSGNAAALASELERLAGDTESLRKKSLNARALFQKEFRAEAVYGDLCSYLEELANGNGRV